MTGEFARLIEEHFTRMSNRVPVMKIIESELMVETVLYARSPARAKRRMKRGFRQHYAVRPMSEIYVLADSAVMHPVMAAQLRARIAANRLAEPGAAAGAGSPFRFPDPLGAPFLRPVLPPTDPIETRQRLDIFSLFGPPRAEGGLVTWPIYS